MFTDDQGVSKKFGQVMSVVGDPTREASQVMGGSMTYGVGCTAFEECPWPRRVNRDAARRARGARQRVVVRNLAVPAT